jgi:hypothetical protein
MTILTFPSLSIERPAAYVLDAFSCKGSVAEWQTAMGIDWTDDRKSIAEAIPPAYAEFIGRHLVSALCLELEGRAA